MMKKLIELDKATIRLLEEKAKVYEPPLKLKPYIEYMLRKLARGELIELKRK